MSSALTLARPYARAAFESARASGSLAGWAGKLAFAAQVAADPRVTALFGDPRIGARDLASLFVPADESGESTFSHFIQLLADNGRLPVLPEIGALFEELKLESERVLKVNLRAASPVAEAEVAKLSEALARRFGRAVEITQSVDEDLLGGAVIDAGDIVIDGSVRGRLERLEHALTH